MTKQNQAIQKLLNENKLKEYDSINLENIGYYLNYGTNIIKHNEIPTLTTNCAVAVVLKGDRNE